MYIYLKYSKHGYEISVVGESENTAKYVGIKVEKVIMRTMALSGAVCGLVGLLLVGGINHTITTTIAGGVLHTLIYVVVMILLYIIGYMIQQRWVFAPQKQNEPEVEKK